MNPTWLPIAIEAGAGLYRLIADAAAGRAADVEAARLGCVLRLRRLADALEELPERERTDHEAAVDEATAAELARRTARLGDPHE